MQAADRQLVHRCTAISAALASCLAFGEAAFAEQPAAIVEDVRSPEAEVEAFQYLRPGKIVHLGDTGVLILGYLTSCLRETISGGQVVIGETESEIQEGSVEREKVECDGGHSNLSAAEAGKSGVVVFRGLEKPEETSQVRPIRIYSSSPIFTFTGSVDEVVIKRLDLSGNSEVLPVEGKTLDLAKLGRRLVPGARYQAKAGGKAQVFQIDRRASPRNEAVIGRLIRF